jgi:hypothetical protein
VSSARADINSFANDLLLDFVDAFHQQMKGDLQAQFGDAWLEQGVQRHLDAPSLDRAQKMLESPMRVVDMGKSDEELYGVEHLRNIVAGNWKTIYGERFGDKERALVYLGEIAEVRHNVSHRRRRHVLRRSEVVRLAQDCAMLLRGIGSGEAHRYEGIVENLNTGGTPWGSGLAGYLPPQDEVVEEFVGRPDQMRDLTSWAAGDRPQVLVWGDGGAGKSALAYEFAREIRVAAPVGLNAVCWVSAKRTEFVAGEARPKRADFIDRTSLVKAIFNAVYETDITEDDLSEQMLLDQLRELPSLIVVDDFDTVLEDEALVEFLMHDVRSTGSRVLYTSRNKVPGVPCIEVLGFEGEELVDFIRVRAFEHELDSDSCSKRAGAIRSVTGGFPLFIDDLLRYARIDGIKGALEDWSQKKGDAAREYALRRQLERLGETSAGVLIALSVSERALTALEMATLAGVTDDDAEDAVRNLLRWKLVGRVPTEDEDRPGFSLNLNTRRLVQRTYGGDPRLDTYRARFTTLGSSRVPAARSARTAMAIGHAKALITRGDVEGAVAVLRDSMTGELADSADLYGALGWAYSRAVDAHMDDARSAFERAYELGATKEDTYFHWTKLELDDALAALGRIADRDLLDKWRKAARIAELGLKACGPRKGLCQLAGYSRSREAKTLARLNEFAQAEVAWAEAVAHFRRGLAATASREREVSRDQLYRGLSIALEGLGDLEGLADLRAEWNAVAPSTDTQVVGPTAGARGSPNRNAIS